MIEPWLMLRNAIIEQAIDDYAKGIGRNHQYIMSLDAEHFFRSEWCQRLLDLDNMKLTGEDIMKAVKRRRLEELDERILNPTDT